MKLGAALDRDIFDQQNLLRKDPKSFIPHLEMRLTRFNGNVYVPGAGLPTEPTAEGPTAIAAAIAALDQQSSVEPLVWNDGLYVAAMDHCLDAGANDLTSWMGSDGSNPGTRMARYGQAGASQGQNLAYGVAQSGMDVVMQLIIDDGVTNRTSRQVLFQPAYKMTGIATCAHKSKTMMASVLYTDKYAINAKGKERIAKLEGQNVRPSVRPVTKTQLSPIVRGQNVELDRAIYFWQNKLRTDPSQFIPVLTALQGRAQTKEPNAIQNALSLLAEMQDGQLSAYEWNEGLNLSAKKHCEDIGGKGLIGHFGTDESSPFNRISEFGKPNWWRGENLVYRDSNLTSGDIDELAKATVAEMFIDDAAAGRPNRHRMLNPAFKQVGVYSCPHNNSARNGSMTVIDYVGSLSLNQNATQGIMEAQEANAEAEAGTPTTVLSKTTKCSNLPKSIVSEKTCYYFEQNNKIRENPKSFIPILQKRLQTIDDVVQLSQSRYSRVSEVKEAQLSYDQYWKTKRAISVLKRQESLAPLVWSDALFLSSYKHCNEQQNGTPMVFTNSYDEQGIEDGKRRPATAVADTANATGVEVNVVTGELVMDLVIHDILDPANREILLNPTALYSSAAVCKHNSGSLAVQNFADSAEANEQGILQLAALVKKVDISDECNSQSDKLYSEKKILQGLLIKQELAQATTTDMSQVEMFEIRKNAIIYQIQLNNEKIEEAKSEVASRVAAKAEYEECDTGLWKFEEQFRKAEDDEQLFMDAKIDLEKRLTSIMGSQLSADQLSSGLTAAQNNIDTATQQKLKAYKVWTDAQNQCQALKSVAFCTAQTDMPASPEFETVTVDNTASSPRLCDPNCGTNLLMAGRKLSSSSETVALAFGSSDLAI